MLIPPWPAVVKNDALKRHPIVRPRIATPERPDRLRGRQPDHCSDLFGAQELHGGEQGGHCGDRLGHTVGDGRHQRRPDAGLGAGRLQKRVHKSLRQREHHKHECLRRTQEGRKGLVSGG